MPVCPKCKKQVRFLERFSNEERKEKFQIGSDGHAEAIWIDTYMQDDGIEDFECPFCDEVLFKDWDKAEAWLKQDYPTASTVVRKEDDDGRT